MESTARSRRKRVIRIVQVAVSVAVVALIFVGVLPRIANYRDVWAALADLTLLELGSLLLITFVNLVTYWPVMTASMPGLTLAQAAVNNQTSTSIANTLPGGGAIAVGITYAMYRSWGFTNGQIALSAVVTGVWNTFIKLALPLVALAILAVEGNASAGLLVASLIGLAVLAVAVVGFGLMLWRERFARAIGGVLGRGVSAVRRLVHRPPVDLAEAAVRFRGQTIQLVSGRWVPLTVATIVSHLALYGVLLVALRHVGVSQAEISWAQVLGVFAFVRLLSAVPITPGGLGVVELGYIGGLVLAGRDDADVSPELFRAQVAAAVLLFRALTYGLQIPLGGVTYVVWRRTKRWLKPVAAATSALVAILLMAACTAGRGPEPGPTAEPGRPVIRVGSFDFAESVLLAEVYAAALEHAGYPVDRMLGIGSREVVQPALRQGFVDLVPEYLGSALEFAQLGEGGATANAGETYGRLVRALGPLGLVVLDPAPASDENAFVVTDATAARYSLREVSDLAPVAGGLVFGGPPECPERPFCLQGLREVYGLQFRSFLALDASGPYTVHALESGDIDVGLMFSTDGRLAAGGLVALIDDRLLQPADNVTPVLRREVADAYGPDLLALLDDISGRLTTQGLAELNRRLAVEGLSPASVAAGWLTEQGL